MASVRKSSLSENTTVIWLLNSRGVYFSSEVEIPKELWSFFFRAMQGVNTWSLATVSVLAPEDECASCRLGQPVTHMGQQGLGVRCLTNTLVCQRRSHKAEDLLIANCQEPGP